MILVDFKTSSSCNFYPSMGYQAAAYSSCLGIDKALICILDKYTPKFKPVFLDKNALDKAFEVFKGLYYAYWAELNEKGDAKKKLERRYNRAIKAGKDPHIYKHPKYGEFVPSVTTIIGIKDKPNLLNWAANCAVDKIIEADKKYNLFDKPEAYKEKVFKAARKVFHAKRKTAATIGTDTHSAIDMYMKGQDIGAINDFLAKKKTEARIAFNNFIDFWVGEKFNIISSEVQVFGKEKNYDKYGGRYDLVITKGE